MVCILPVRRMLAEDCDISNFRVKLSDVVILLALVCITKDFLLVSKDFFSNLSLTGISFVFLNSLLLSL